MERSAESITEEYKMQALVKTLLKHLGEDPKRDGLRDTPERVVKMWAEVFSGYKVDPGSLFTTFVEPECDEMIVLKGIEFVSHCEHHIMPFQGVAHIGYLPSGGQIVGVSKLARLLDCFARRLQIQERIGTQVVESIMEYLKPVGCGCVLEADHLCIRCRGVGKQGSTMVTSSTRGSFRDAEVRSEFLRMIGK